jgi:hypothetical protein
MGNHRRALQLLLAGIVFSGTEYLLSTLIYLDHADLMVLPETAVVCAGAFGICLLFFRVRWGYWLLVPGAIWFVLLPVARPVLPLIPLWLWLIALPVVPIFLLITSIRVGQAIIRGLFGADTAAHVVAHWLIGLIGSFGRARRRPFGQPQLPRPRQFFDPHDIGGVQ